MLKDLVGGWKTIFQRFFNHKKMDKKYFRITSNNDMALIGAFPRVYEYLDENKDERNNSVSFRAYSNIVDKNFDFIQLTNKAKTTDFFWCEGRMNGIFLSNRVLELLDNFNICQYERIPINFLRKNVILSDFHWCVFEKDENIIDFALSEFQIVKHGNNDFVKKVRLDSMQDYYELSKDLGNSLKIEPLNIKLTSYANSLDLFHHPLLAIDDLFVSDSLLLFIREMNGFKERAIKHWNWC
jgi:hypothetical protein